MKAERLPLVRSMTVSLGGSARRRKKSKSGWRSSKAVQRTAAIRDMLAEHTAANRGAVQTARRSSHHHRHSRRKSVPCLKKPSMPMRPLWIYLLTSWPRTRHRLNYPKSTLPGPPNCCLVYVHWARRQWVLLHDARLLKWCSHGRLAKNALSMSVDGSMSPTPASGLSFIAPTAIACIPRAPVCLRHLFAGMACGAGKNLKSSFSRLNQASVVRWPSVY